MLRSQKKSGTRVPAPHDTLPSTTPKPQPTQCLLLRHPLVPPPILIPSSSGALPQRSPLNHMCQLWAYSRSRANCSLVNGTLSGGGLPFIQTQGKKKKKAGWVSDDGGDGFTNQDLSMQFIFFPRTSLEIVGCNPSCELNVTNTP